MQLNELVNTDGVPDMLEGKSIRVLMWCSYYLCDLGKGYLGYTKDRRVDKTKNLDSELLFGMHGILCIGGVEFRVWLVSLRQLKKELK